MSLGDIVFGVFIRAVGLNGSSNREMREHWAEEERKGKARGSTFETYNWEENRTNFNTIRHDWEPTRFKAQITTPTFSHLLTDDDADERRREREREREEAAAERAREHRELMGQLARSFEPTLPAVSFSFRTAARLNTLAPQPQSLLKVAAPLDLSRYLPEVVFSPRTPPPEPIGFVPFSVKQAREREQNTRNSLNAAWDVHNRREQTSALVDSFYAGKPSSSTDLERACTPRPLDNHMPSNPFSIPGREPLPMGPF